MGDRPAKIKKEGDAVNNKVTTPSITQGQIGKILELLAARLRKSGLQSDTVQRVLEIEGKVVANKMFEVFRRRVEASSDILVRYVTGVDRTRDPEDVLTATSMYKSIDYYILPYMPRGKGKRAKVYFFRVGRWVSDEELEEEYASRGLTPADPYTLVALNEADPRFADLCPNATHWRYPKEKWWFYVAFRRENGRRCLRASRRLYGWGSDWWFAGLRK